MGPEEEDSSVLVDVAADHPAALLALLPGDTSNYAFLDIGALSERPELREHVEFQIGHFVGEDELPLAAKLLLSVGTADMVLSTPFSTNEWTCVIRGDFTLVGEALRAAAQSGTGLSVGVAEIHAGTDIYTLVRMRSSGYETEIYLAVLAEGVLAASPSVGPLREAIDRHRDGGSLPESLAAMVAEWGLGDYFFAASLSDLGGFVEGPTGEARYFAYHATLEEESTTVLRGMWQFEGEEDAALAAAWLQAQPEPHWRNIGWGASVSVEQWRRRGPTVYGEAVVPDEELPALVQGN